MAAWAVFITLEKPCLERRYAVEREDNAHAVTTSYKEIEIGKTTYRVTSVFLGEKDLGRTLEQLAVRRAVTEITANADNACEHPACAGAVSM